jgi:uncharacterized protein with gpF-like domain
MVKVATPAKRQLRMMDAIERAHMPQIAAELARAYVEYIAAWEQGRGFAVDLDHERRMTAIIESMARMAVRAFGAETDRLLKRIERKDFAATLAKLASRYISLEAFRRRITDIAETTRQNVIDAVQRGFDAGLGQEGVGGFVRSLVPSFSRQRANLIARTETHGAANYGAVGAAAETGLTLRKVWIAAEDERTREEHAAMNGTAVDMGAAFDFGAYSLMYPGDPSGPAEAVINCRCTLGYEPVD